MNKYEFTNPKTGRKYERITKNQARKLFNAGNSFVMVPCKCRLFTMWGLDCFIDGYDERESGRTFDTIINMFTYYNCNNELGYYPAFYVISL